MPSERIRIERTLPERWHVEIEYGPPTYVHRIVDVSSLAEALAEVTAAVAKIEPPATSPANSDGHVSDVDGAHMEGGV